MCSGFRPDRASRLALDSGPPHDGEGGYTTAAALTAFYQMLLAGGTFKGARVRPARQRLRREEPHRRPHGPSQGVPMHRGVGVYLRGETPIGWMTRTLAPATTFGHGGTGPSISWADPESGLSFTYIQNSRREGRRSSATKHVTQLHQQPCARHTRGSVAPGERGSDILSRLVSATIAIIVAFGSGHWRAASVSTLQPRVLPCINVLDSGSGWALKNSASRRGGRAYAPETVIL